MGDTETGRIRIARVFGIPIYIHFSWILIFALIAWTLATGYFPEREPELSALSSWARGLIASLLFFVSILLHELGHSWVALRLGIGIRSITLFVFGGVARLANDPRDGRSEFKIAAAGPVVSLVLAALFAATTLLPLGGAWRGIAGYLSAVNLIVAIFNLVPAFPLDGGRLLRGLLWPRLGKLKATRAAAGAGTFFAYFLILTGAVSLLRGNGVAGMWNILIGWFLKEAASAAYRQVRLDDALQGRVVGEAMARDVKTLPGDMSLEEAAREHFARTGFAAYPVTRGEAIVGVLTLRDVLRHAPDERAATSVQGAMIPLADAIVASPDDPLDEALSRLAASPAGRLLVLEEGRLVGLLTLRGVLAQLRAREQLRTG